MIAIGNKLSDAQTKALRMLLRRDGRGRVQVAGYGRAGELSACNALVRKGLAMSYRTGYFSLTDAGRDMASELPSATHAPAKEPK